MSILLEHRISFRFIFSHPEKLGPATYFKDGLTRRITSRIAHAYSEKNVPTAVEQIVVCPIRLSLEFTYSASDERHAPPVPRSIQ